MPVKQPAPPLRVVIAEDAVLLREGLRRAPAASDHCRVLAVLTYLHR